MKHKQRHRGFTLIEVLVALLVLSIGLLGLAMLQILSLKSGTDAYFRTQATLFAYDIVDRMRANRAVLGNYHVPDETTVNTALGSYNSCASACNCDGSVCTSAANMALYDLGKWYELQNQVLPIPAIPSTIAVNGNVVTVTMRWQERDLGKTQSWTAEL